jgi:hypothetical protein
LLSGTIWCYRPPLSCAIRRSNRRLSHGEQPRALQRRRRTGICNSRFCCGDLERLF